MPTMTKRLGSFVLTSLCAFSLSACGGGNLPLPGGVNGADDYKLPLKLSQNLECDGGSNLIYEISSTGEFKFLASETPAKPTFITRQLSQADQEALDALLESTDLAARQAALKQVPADAPQTADCRAIETLSLTHEGKTADIERNGRKRETTADYLEAFAKVRAKLDELKTKYAPTPSGENPMVKYRYETPLTLKAEGECGLPNYTRYEILADGTFRYAKTSPDPTQPDAPALTERKLSETERQALNAKLAELDLAAQAEADTKVPDDAPQTMECRTVNVLSLNVNGQSRSFDQNGRKLNHSEAYRQAFTQLLNHLESIPQALHPTPGPGVQYAYALPLKVRLDGECGLPDFTRFEIGSNGQFTWTREDWPTLAAGNPPTESRQLTAAEQAQVMSKLNDSDLLEQAAQSEVVPADAPQTKECRTVTVYDLTADNSAKSFEGEGTRKFRHSEALLAKTAGLQKLLYELSGQPVPDHLKSDTP